MTESQIRSKVIQTAKKYLGCKESNGSHKQIIDRYNSHKPLARKYPVKYTDAWCATFVSAVAIECGYTDIMPTECSCSKMITLYKNLGRWQESDSHIPSLGDVIMYDWDDSGSGDNKGSADHVGIVVSVSGNKIKIIEGNYGDSVAYRTIKVNDKYIRGYCLPDYASKADSVEAIAPVTLPKDEKKEHILEWQKAAIADGFKFPKYGADGEWGAECESVAKNAIVKKRASYLYKNLTKIVQRTVGVEADGLCGGNTSTAIKKYQKANKLDADGAVGINTWRKILGVK